MKQARIWIAVLTLWAAAVLATPATSHAQYTGVFPVHAAALGPEDRAAIGTLISNAYAEVTQTSVLTPEELAPILQQAGTETRAAEQLGLYEYLHVEAVTLHSRIVLYAQLRDTHGRSLYEVRDTVFSLEDMEIVSQRMAVELAHRGRRYERHRSARLQPSTYSEKLFGVRLALVMPQARKLETQASLLCQFDVRLERRYYFVELAAGFWLPSETNERRQGVGGFVGHVGGSYYLLQESVSPYIGLGVSPRFFTGAYTGAGLAINAHVGVMFMRESSTRLYLELRVDQNLMRAQRRDSGSDEVGGDAREILPTELSFAVGLGF